MAVNKDPTLLDGDLPVSNLGSCEVEENGHLREAEGAGRESQGTWSKICLNSKLVHYHVSIIPAITTFCTGLWEDLRGEKRCQLKTKPLGEKGHKSWLGRGEERKGRELLYSKF